jgi:hypothetical protein
MVKRVSPLGANEGNRISGSLGNSRFHPAPGTNLPRRIGDDAELKRIVLTRYQETFTFLNYKLIRLYI